MSLSSLLYCCVRLICGILYPAFYSFKAVKNKNVKEYFQWMIYWIVFAMVTIIEELADLFISFWFPLYYELKILFLIWLLSPATRGATLLYRQVIHPNLARREEEIDEFLKKCKDESYSLGVKYTRAVAESVTNTVIQTALAGGGGLVRTLRHSYSVGDLSRGEQREVEEEEEYEERERVVPISWHEDTGYKQIQEEKVEMRKVRGRRKDSTSSTLSLTSEGMTRVGKNSSLYCTMPRQGSRVARVASRVGGTTTVPRRSRRHRGAIPVFEPLEKREEGGEETVVVELRKNRKK